MNGKMNRKRNKAKEIKKQKTVNRKRKTWQVRKSRDEWT